MNQYFPKGYGPEPDDICESGYKSPIPPSDRAFLDFPSNPTAITSWDQSSDLSKIFPSGESNFFDVYQDRSQHGGSGLNFHFPSGDFEYLRDYLKSADYTLLTPEQVDNLDSKELAKFILDNSGVFVTSQESYWTYPSAESGLLNFGRGDGTKYYRYYDLSTTTPLGDRVSFRVEEDITSLYSHYSNALNVNQSQLEDFTLFNPYIHYSPFRSFPKATDYRYVFINYLSDYKVSTQKTNPYKF